MKMYLQKLFTKAFYFLSLVGFHYVLSTEVSVTSTSLLEYLGVEIHLPVLLCHPKHTGYKEVIWKKDFVTVKNGSANLASHVLPLESLLDSNFSALDNPFKLQGYYWCETDVSSSAYVHEYLFQIKNIYTYVGKLVARNDSLGQDDEGSFRARLSWKKLIYEDEMQSVLFRGLHYLNVSVTDMKVLERGGLEIHFFLYVREVYHPRKRPDNLLITDQEHLLDIKDYLENEISSGDESTWFYSRDWIESLGINYQDIDLRSTLGCYEEASSSSLDPIQKVSWPYARIGDVVIPSNACLTRNGLAVTRLCTGTFHSGAKWGNPSGKCEKPPSEITVQIKSIYDNYGRSNTSAKITSLTVLTDYATEMGISDLHIIADILDQLSRRPKLTKQEISGILSIIDNLMDVNKTEMDAAKNIIRVTSRFLRIFEHMLEQANREGKEIRISKRHLMVDTKFTNAIDESDLVLGLAVHVPENQDALSNGSVEFLLSDEKLQNIDSIAHFSLPEKLVLERISSLEIPCQVNMVFFKDWRLFQNPRDVLVKRNYRVLPTPVMFISISGGPAWNLTDPVQIYFKDTEKEEIENPVCVYYDSRLDDGVGAWSSEGCEYKGLEFGYYHCQCHHLSIFAVILSKRPFTYQQNFKLGSSVYVGCGVSIIALALVIVLFILSKNWRKTVDHCILFCLSLTFFTCIVIIFISETRFKRKPGCIVLAMIFHYTIFATFGWLMVQAVIYRLRFAKKTDVSEIPHFMIKAALSVWGVPIIIVIIIWFTKDFSYSVKDGCWLTMYEVAKVSVIPVVILIKVTLCIHLCATYALTCQYKKDFLIGDAVYNDVVVKFRVAFTIFAFFVLSWLFGFLALHNRSQTLRILFSISITLTAYYVTLFFIFQEVSFWDLCKCCKRQEQEDTPVIQYKAKSYDTTAETTTTEK